jgi:hypothetical protein
MVCYPGDPSSHDPHPTWAAHWAHPLEAEWVARGLPPPGQWPILTLQVGCGARAAGVLLSASSASKRLSKAHACRGTPCRGATCRGATCRGAPPLPLPEAVTPLVRHHTNARPSLFGGQVCSYDPWDRYTCEGYGWLQLGPLAACSSHVVHTWKPLGAMGGGGGEGGDLGSGAPLVCSQAACTRPLPGGCQQTLKPNAQSPPTMGHFLASSAPPGTAGRWQHPAWPSPVSAFARFTHNPVVPQAHAATSSRSSSSEAPSSSRTRPTPPKRRPLPRRASRPRPPRLRSVARTCLAPVAALTAALASGVPAAARARRLTNMDLKRSPAARSSCGCSACSRSPPLRLPVLAVRGRRTLRPLAPAARSDGAREGTSGRKRGGSGRSAWQWCWREHERGLRTRALAVAVLHCARERQWRRPQCGGSRRTWPWTRVQQWPSVLRLR